MRARPTSARPPDHVLLHPAWLGALAVLVVNDHLLKGAGLLPGWLTGKLSDFAGLVVAPALLAIALRARGARALAACHVAVGAGFALLKLWPAAAGAWSWALSGLLPSRLWSDPTDLVALPALGASWWLVGRASRGPAPERDRGRKLVVAAFGLFGCVATSRTSEPPAVPKGGSLYAPKYGEGVYVIDSKTGRLRGKLEEFDQSVVAWGETVYRAANRQIVAFDVASRQERVVASEPGRALWPIAADEARLYVLATGPKGGSSSPGYLMAFDRVRGTKRWVGRERIESENVEVVGDWLFVRGWAKGEMSVGAVDARTGVRRWVVSPGQPIRRAALGGDLVLFGVGTYGDPGELRAFEVESGRLRWSFRAVGPATEVGATEDLAIVASNQAIEAVDLATGQKRWGTNPREHRYHSPAAAPIDGILLVQCSSAVCGLRVADGSEAWKLEFPLNVGELSASTRDGVFYVRAYRGELAAIEPKTGKVLWLLDDAARLGGVRLGVGGK
jgi:outer membrane protein assembly factor BamB